MLDFSFASHQEILQELCARLRAHRLAQNLTQEALAGMAGVSPGTIKNLERRGISSLGTAIRVTRALGLIDQLQGLFMLQRQSIAQMEQAERSQRQRARPRAP